MSQDRKYQPITGTGARAAYAMRGRAALGEAALPRLERCVFTAAQILCNYMLAVAFRASEIYAATGGAPVGRA